MVNKWNCAEALQKGCQSLEIGRNGLGEIFMSYF